MKYKLGGKDLLKVPVASSLVAGCPGALRCCFALWVGSGEFTPQQARQGRGWAKPASPLLTVPGSVPQERFTADCQFRERFQENSYNTYASAVHRSPRSGRQWYVALNKRGKAKRGCSPRARPQHVSTHFLPRFRQPQPPELAFTVTLPEKKPPPPPKPKVAPSPPRKSPGPVKYRLKFRFG